MPPEKILEKIKEKMKDTQVGIEIWIDKEEWESRDDKVEFIIERIERY